MKEKDNEKNKIKIRLSRVIIIVLLIIAIIAIIVVVVNNNNKKEEEQQAPQTAIELPDTTYSDMQVKNVNMEYLAENDETMVSLTIDNTTNNTVKQKNLNAMLVNADGQVLGQLPTYIESLEPGEQYDISVILKGDLTATTQVALKD